MAQPSIPGTAVGIPRMAYGNDGTNWIAVLVDALGHIQADILSTVLPTDAATQTTLASCLTALQLIDDLRNALGSVNTDDLQVDVKTSALPSGAAIETKQDTMVTALQLIDDLRNALGSVNTDDLQVDVKTYPGVNALLNIPFGYNDRLVEEVEDLTAGADWNTLNGTAVPAGEVWVVTVATMADTTSNCGFSYLEVLQGGVEVPLENRDPAAANDWLTWTGIAILKEGDAMRAIFSGCTLNDDIYLRYSGYKMKVA